jgi:hypothetical protein
MDIGSGVTQRTKGDVPITVHAEYGVSFPISGPVAIAISGKPVGVAGFEPATPSSRTRRPAPLHRFDSSVARAPMTLDLDIPN